MPTFFEIVCQTLDEIHDTFLVVSISKRSTEKQDTDQLKAGIFVGSSSGGNAQRAQALTSVNLGPPVP